ncbi:Mitochondrial substrate carrier family protein [Hibiscus syriacus]|uniref:Mitochondrial substrate carrier family protein n=1 Tax=Hibiscus syriacus TaxID=106335 RepID=A0A6A2XN05_HIBSY|nr:Mitochondrial substrate carrier family protein [Hibiscus syriacus]
MQQYNEVELSALGMAIANVVTIAEILKNNGLAIEKKIMTSTIDMREESGGRRVQKAKVSCKTVKSIRYIRRPLVMV